MGQVEEAEAEAEAPATEQEGEAECTAEAEEGGGEGAGEGLEEGEALGVGSSTGWGRGTLEQSARCLVTLSHLLRLVPDVVIPCPTRRAATPDHALSESLDVIDLDPPEVLEVSPDRPAGKRWVVRRKEKPTPHDRPTQRPLALARPGDARPSPGRRLQPTLTADAPEFQRPGLAATRRYVAEERPWSGPLVPVVDAEEEVAEGSDTGDVVVAGEAQSTNTLCVENLTPGYADFTLRPALAEFGEPLRFWIDRGQTQCYVQYATVQAAVQTCRRLARRRNTSGQPLRPKFVDPAELRRVLAAEPPAPIRPISPPPPPVRARHTHPPAERLRPERPPP
eukprot:EG_transcript_19066